MLIAATMSAIALLKVSQMQWFDIRKRLYRVSGNDLFVNLRFQILIPKPWAMIGSKEKLSLFITKIHDYANDFI